MNRKAKCKICNGLKKSFPTFRIIMIMQIKSFKRMTWESETVATKPLERSKNVEQGCHDKIASLINNKPSSSQPNQTTLAGLTCYSTFRDFVSSGALRLKYCNVSGNKLHEHAHFSMTSSNGSFLIQSSIKVIAQLTHQMFFSRPTYFCARENLSILSEEVVNDLSWPKITGKIFFEVTRAKFRFF